MTSRRIYAEDSLFGLYESLIRQQLGDSLDSLNKLLTDISNDCAVKLINVPSSIFGLTAENLLQVDSKQRRRTVSAFFYDDAVWRLKATYLMLSMGLLNHAYDSLHMSVETFIKAFVVERVDSEARKFLKNEDIDLRKIERLIPPDYNKRLLELKRVLRYSGVHSKFDSIQLTTMYGPSMFNKIVEGARKATVPPKLPDGFVKAASRCIEYATQMGVIFVFLIHKKP
jgi:hypothetical protein